MSSSPKSQTANSVLIYDGDCAYCQGFVNLLKKFRGKHNIITIQYNDKRAQKLLIAQFGTLFGFSMYFIEAERVSWGKEAAKRIVSSLSLPRWLSSIAFTTYPSLVNVVSKLTGRSRKVCGPECFGAAEASEEKMWVGTSEETQKLLFEIEEDQNYRKANSAF